MQRVIEPELDVHAQLEQALARIAELEKELFVLRGKSNAVYYLPTSSSTGGTITVTGLSIGDVVTSISGYATSPSTQRASSAGPNLDQLKVRK